ncbi:NAD(P)-binding protein [Microthyrium microscopicum]|uniref:NAD(P)-binding protein n=1 Tax=Microthyrium microscopicum TaxID=703497 RepID=A0A6A6U2Q8_9PEZI|nr:NAD(P)-binding protein [Microthyrium microscopicum]
MMGQANNAAIIITGAASGLGAAFLSHYATVDPSRPIIAIDQAPIILPPHLEKSTAIRTLTLDVTDTASLASFSSEIVGVPVLFLIHCAGIRGLVQEIVRSNSGDVAAAEMLEVMDAATMMKTFQINCLGTFNIIRTLIPNLLNYNSDRAANAPPPRCIIMGSRMGSVGANVAGGGYAYRASKAALNAVIKSFSLDVTEVIFTIIHPGRVETGLVAWKEDGAISTEESVRDCVKLFDAFGPAYSGKFLDRFGEPIVW